MGATHHLTEMRTVQTVSSNSSTETERLGAEFALSLNPGDVVALYGDLGSGKTTFVRGICAGLGLQQRVSSPTFTLINEYIGRVPVYHFDFYRIENTCELYELGYDEYFYGDGICLIEWADRIAELLPKHRFEVTFENVFTDSNLNQRRISIENEASCD